MITRRITESIARHAARRFNRKEARLELEQPVISFTFDDIPVSAAEAGAQCLEAAGARGTFYVSGQLLGRTSDYGEPCACLDMIQQLATRGHEIACHTYAHKRVGDLSAADLREDLRQNAVTFREIGSLRNFAYPFNAPATQAKRILGERFHTARGGVPGINLGIVDLSYLRAVPLQSDPVEGLDFEQWIAEACKARGWLVFFTHDVGPDPSPYGTTQEVLERAILAAKRHGAVIRTVAGALDDKAQPRNTRSADREYMT